VAPLNENEIAILGGWDGMEYFGDVIVFNTKTEKCIKVVSAGDYKFFSEGNQCAQVSLNKVVALVRGDLQKPGIILWTKGLPSVVILEHLPK